jgi:ABC-type glycerol-3-phosphate transport system permease component
MSTLERTNPIQRLTGYVAAITVSAVFIFPFVWMLASSFKNTREILQHPLRLIPEHFTLSAYQTLARIAGNPIQLYLYNSIVIVGSATILATVITALGAYAIWRRPKLPLFGLIEKMFLISIMYPYILLLMPVYVIMFRIGLLGSRLGIVLFLTLGPIQYFLFREFFAKIPKELIESAQIDGAREIHMFAKVVVPMARPVFMTVFLLSFILNWENWFPVLIISTSMKTYTLPVVLFNFDSQLEVNFPEIMALAAVVSIPIMVVFLLTQRRVMDGFAAGSIKG